MYITNMLYLINRLILLLSDILSYAINLENIN
jgi:hypothetical protein